MQNAFTGENPVDRCKGHFPPSIIVTDILSDMHGYETSSSSLIDA